MRMLEKGPLLGLAMAACLAGLGAAAPEGEKKPDAPKAPPRVAEVELTGIVAVRHSFFDVAKDALKAEQDFKAPKEALADRILVTAAGVYSFAEFPRNAELLKDFGPDTTVTVRGKNLIAGSLLWLDQAEKAQGGAPIDVAKFSKAKGEKTVLEGTNRCQCQLDVAGLPHSCKLGHLHHFQAPDGTVYHYLPIGVGATNLSGKGVHGKAVRVKALLLPGNHLLVESTELK